jgi:hypothetical protein
VGPVQQLLVGKVVQVTANGGGRDLVVHGRRVDVDPPVGDKLFEQRRQPFRACHQIPISFLSGGVSL